MLCVSVIHLCNLYYICWPPPNLPVILISPPRNVKVQFYCNLIVPAPNDMHIESPIGLPGYLISGSDIQSLLKFTSNYQIHIMQCWQISKLTFALLHRPIFSRIISNWKFSTVSGVILQRLWFNLMQFICQATRITYSAKSFQQNFMGLWDEFKVRLRKN